MEQSGSECTRRRKDLFPSSRATTGDKGGRWRRTWDCRPIKTMGDRSANDGWRGGHGLARWRSLATPGGPRAGSTWVKVA
jgi:hypothetical protein